MKIKLLFIMKGLALIKAWAFIKGLTLIRVLALCGCCMLMVLALCGCLSANRPAPRNAPGVAQAPGDAQAPAAVTAQTGEAATAAARTTASAAVALTTQTAAADADDAADGSGAADRSESADGSKSVEELNAADGPEAAEESELVDGPEASDESPSNAFAFPYAFTAKDLYGTEVTEASLGDKELFFVHYWATWCGPCVNEMPELASIADKYGGRVGFIALLDDYGTSRDTAVKITDKSGVGFIMVDARHGDFMQLLRMVQSGYVPTTVLIGKDGGIIGEQIIGALGGGYTKLIDAALGS